MAFYKYLEKEAAVSGNKKVPASSAWKSKFSRIYFWGRLLSVALTDKVLLFISFYKNSALASWLSAFSLPDCWLLNTSHKIFIFLTIKFQIWQKIYVLSHLSKFERRLLKRLLWANHILFTKWPAMLKSFVSSAVFIFFKGLNAAN